MLKVVKVEKRERVVSYHTGGYREYHRAPRLYVWPKNETALDNLANRHSRPHREYRKLLPEIFAVAGLPVETKARWSQYAGCSCPCSPGFILEASGKFDIHVNVVDMTEE